MRVTLGLVATMVVCGCASSGRSPAIRPAREAGAVGQVEVTSTPGRPDAPAGEPAPSAPAPPGGGAASVVSPSPPPAATVAPAPQASWSGASPLDAMRDIHDPAIIREGGWYYVFSTGAGVPIHRSRDLVHWEDAGRVFRLDVPDWARREVPGATAVWAPDIAHVDGRYVLTYSVSTFGQQRSIIGMASTPTLDPSSRANDWRHDGKVVESMAGDDHNAIDSNLLVDSSGRAWVSWGSYWTGLKMVELDRATLRPIQGAPVETIARREADGGVEAPFIVERNGWFYLFASYDRCCKGVESTYNIRVGRSRSPTGPYHDRDNKPMTRGGGTVILETTGRVIGPGHCAVLRDGPSWFLVHHFYDGQAAGVPTLQVRELLWDHLGWPRAGAVIGGL